MKKIYFITIVCCGFILYTNSFYNQSADINIANPIDSTVDQAILSVAATLTIPVALALFLIKKEYGSTKHFTNAINKNGLSNEIQTLQKTFNQNDQHLLHAYYQEYNTIPHPSATIYNYPTEAEVYGK